MARPAKPLNEQLMLKKYLEGSSSRQIAREFGCSQQTVMNRIGKYVDVKVRFSVDVQKSLKS